MEFAVLGVGLVALYALSKTQPAENDLPTSAPLGGAYVPNQLAPRGGHQMYSHAMLTDPGMHYPTDQWAGYPTGGGARRASR